MPESDNTSVVQASNGRAGVSAGGLSSNGFNLPHDTGLDYDSQNAGTSHGFGNGWLPGSLAGLGGTASGGGPSAGAVTYTTAPDRTLTFLPDGPPGTYKAAYFIKDQLSFDIGAGRYNLLAAGGSSKQFDSNGRLVLMRNPGGDTSVFSYIGSEIETVVMTVGGVTVSYDYGWSAGRVEEIFYSVAGRAVLRTTYGYSDGLLQTVKTWENSTAGTGTPDWGSSPISATRFSYHSTSGLLRHVVPPTQYRQMVLNGLNPDSPDIDQLDDYAAAEYDYGYRYLDTQLGRWLSRDTIGERGGLNLFGFAGNDGPNKIDYLGKHEVDPKRLGDDDTGPNTWEFELIGWHISWECRSKIESCCDGKNWEVIRANGKSRRYTFIHYRHGHDGIQTGEHDFPPELIIPFYLWPNWPFDEYLSALSDEAYVEAFNATVDSLGIIKKSLGYRGCATKPAAEITCTGTWMKTGLLPSGHSHPVDHNNVTIDGGELDPPKAPNNKF